jgi:CubicO group peptidase (beta-lactamase class C family)
MSEFLAMIDDYVPPRLAEMKLPGAALALIENSELKSVRCYGSADVARGRPITPDTLFQVASISKSFAAWGVMKLVERGLVDLDKPVNDYLSRWKLPGNGFDARAVTPRLLLMHFGGTSLSGCGGTPYDAPWYRIEDTLNGTLPPLDPLQREYLLGWGMDIEPYGQPVRLIHEPGSTFAYSGGGFTILELLIEERSGKDFTSFMDEEVLGPLGMPESTFELRPAQRDKVAVGYSAKLEPVPLYRINGKAAGGLYSNIVELARFACAEMQGPAGEPPGRGVLSADSIRAMHHPYRFAESQMGFDFHTGLGHYVLDIGGVRAVQHTGGNFGWRSVYTVVPDKKLGFVCLVNSAGGNEFWLDLINRWASGFLAG